MSAAVEDWLAGAETPRRRGGRPQTNGTGRQRKLECQACGFIAYASRRACERVRPICCGEALQLANLRDRADIEPEQLEQDLGGIYSPAFAAAMRELGRTDEIPRKPPRERRGGLAPARCKWEGGYCMVFVSGRYCSEHDPAEIRRREARRGA